MTDTKHADGSRCAGELCAWKGDGGHTVVPVQQQITIPASLMHAIEAVCSSEMSPTEKYEATVLICHGYGLWERQATFDPTSYAIPDAQWQEICGRLTDAGKTNGDIAAVNLGLAFMNQGPSGYKEAI